MILRSHSLPLLVGSLLIQGVVPFGDSLRSYAAEPGGDENAAEVVGYELTFPALGTLVTLKAFHHEQSVVEAAFELAQQRVQEVASVLTDYDPNSETRQLSLTAAKAPTKVSDDLWAALMASDNWYRRSSGAFDASLGQLTSLWRKYRRAGRIPPAREIETALERCGWQHVRLQPEAQAVAFDIADLRLDFGAIGKGYIVDQTYEVLRSNGLSSCLVNISGNMRCGAPPPERQGWRIEVSPLEAGGEPLRRIHLANAAIATSGDLWQFVVVDGKRLSHILAPQTGWGVMGPVSATVVAESATHADALATVACILPWEELVSEQGILRKGVQTGGGELLVARRAPNQDISIQMTRSFPKPISP